ncbi:hypothetical protein AQ610_30535 [Burkholderia humptydooensis]|nr:hypothetical protein AQ610_30535 [Burkholderia humptydooensis]
MILERERRARIGAAHRRVEDARVFRVHVAFRIFEADAHAPVALALLRQHAPHQIGPRRRGRRNQRLMEPAIARFPRGAVPDRHRLLPRIGRVAKRPKRAGCRATRSAVYSLTRRGGEWGAIQRYLERVGRRVASA